MGRAQSHLLNRELEVASLDLSVVAGNELLNHLNRGLLKIYVRFWNNFLDFLEVIHANVLVSVGLEDFTSDFTTLESLCVNEVAVLASGATIRSMEVAARDCPEVARLDDLVHACHSLLSRNLIELGHLLLSLFVHFFVLRDCLIGKLDENIGLLARSFHQEAADALLLFYRSENRG